MKQSPETYSECLRKTIFHDNAETMLAHMNHNHKEMSFDVYDLEDDSGHFDIESIFDLEKMTKQIGVPVITSKEIVTEKVECDDEEKKPMIASRISKDDESGDDGLVPSDDDMNLVRVEMRAANQTIEQSSDVGDTGTTIEWSTEPVSRFHSPTQPSRTIGNLSYHDARFFEKNEDREDDTPLWMVLLQAL